jgi:hypothetical protein
VKSPLASKSIRSRNGAAVLQLLGTALLLGALITLVVASLASATPPTVGTSVPDSAVPVGTFTADTPFASGQGINVVIPANSVFSNHTNLAIVECSAPNGVIPTLSAACDGSTIQGVTLKSNTDGSVNLQTETGSLYTVYALPDSISLGEGSGGPACGNTAATECILYIGYNYNDFTQPHVWSQLFYVKANGDDGGENPGDGTPEVPLAILLPASALGLFGGAALIRRRRNNRLDHSVNA